MGTTLPLDRYNFRHFRPRHLLRDAMLTVRAAGIEPGRVIPDFELARVDGGTLSSRHLRGRVVLLRFGSFT